MKVQILLNEAQDIQGRHIGFFGWKPEHPMRIAFDGDIEFETKKDLHQCEELFAKFNHGSGQEQPEYYDRSLSVGDIVIIDDQAFVCETMGFKLINSNLILIQ